MPKENESVNRKLLQPEVASVLRLTQEAIRH
jgi:hypothetical protein